MFFFVFFFTRLFTFIETTICELAILYDIVSTWSCTSSYQNFADHARYDAMFDKFMMARSVFYPCTLRDTNKFRFSEKSDIMPWKGMQLAHSTGSGASDTIRSIWRSRRELHISRRRRVASRRVILAGLKRQRNKMDIPIIYDALGIFPLAMHEQGKNLDADCLWNTQRAVKNANVMQF